MKESRYSKIMAHSVRSMKAAALLSCVLFMGAQTVWAGAPSDSMQSDRQVVEQQRVEKNIPGSYHYQSEYEMTKDEEGTYRSTYESRKNEWFCCLNWFSSKDETSTDSEKS